MTNNSSNQQTNDESNVLEIVHHYRVKQDYVPNASKFEGISESIDRYKEWPVSVRPKPKKLSFVSPNEDRDFRSTIQSDYVSHHVEKHKPRPPAKYIPTEAKFAGESIQHSDYKQPSLANRAQPIKPSYIDSLTHASTFEGSSESQAEYKKWPTPNRPQKRIAKYVPSEAKFDGLSSQKTDFQVWPLSNRAIPIKPSQVDSLTHPARFEGTTENLDVYRQWPTPKRPEKRISKYIPTEGQLDGVSTQKSDYLAWSLANRAQPIKPSHVDSLTHPASFEGISESQNEYKLWPTPRRPQKRISKYVPSEAKFEGISTQKMDYQEMSLANRSQPIKPSYTDSLTHPAKFEGTTESQAEYCQWPTPNRPQKRISKYSPSEARFEGISTQKSDFHAFSHPTLTQSFSPQLKYKPIKEDRDFVSETKAALSKLANVKLRIRKADPANKKQPPINTKQRLVA